MVLQGCVFAVDPKPNMVRHLAEQAKRSRLDNISATQTQPADSKLPGKVDQAILVDLYHHIDNGEQYFRRPQDSNRAGGRRSLTSSSTCRWVRNAHRIASGKIKTELQGASYAFAEEHGFLPT